MDKDIVKKLNELEIDILKETINIGSSHAATAISQMINKKIELSVPKIRFSSLEELNSNLIDFSESTEKATGVYLELTDEFSGSIVYIFSEKSALALADILMGRKVGTSKEMGEIENSAIMEVANIVVSAYALGNFVEARVLLTPPKLKHDLPGSVIEEIRKKVEGLSTAMIFDTKMKEQGNLFQSYFIFLPHPHSMERIINKLISYINE